MLRTISVLETTLAVLMTGICLLPETWVPLTSVTPPDMSVSLEITAELGYGGGGGSCCVGSGTLTDTAGERARCILTGTGLLLEATEGGGGGVVVCCCFCCKENSYDGGGGFFATAASAALVSTATAVAV